MEVLSFTLVAIGCYLAADRILRWLERVRGATLEHRALVFFGILLGLVLVSFALVRRVAG